MAPLTGPELDTMTAEEIAARARAGITTDLATTSPKLRKRITRAEQRAQARASNNPSR